jgi:hypothetical protein
MTITKQYADIYGPARDQGLTPPSIDFPALFDEFGDVRPVRPADLKQIPTKVAERYHGALSIVGKKIPIQRLPDNADPDRALSMLMTTPGLLATELSESGAQKIKDVARSLQGQGQQMDSGRRGKVVPLPERQKLNSTFQKKLDAILTNPTLAKKIIPRARHEKWDLLTQRSNGRLKFRQVLGSGGLRDIMRCRKNVLQCDRGTAVHVAPRIVDPFGKVRRMRPSRSIVFE